MLEKLSLVLLSRIICLRCMRNYTPLLRVVYFGKFLTIIKRIKYGKSSSFWAKSKQHLKLRSKVKYKELVRNNRKKHSGIKPFGTRSVQKLCTISSTIDEICFHEASWTFCYGNSFRYAWLTRRFPFIFKPSKDDPPSALISINKPVWVCDYNNEEGSAWWVQNSELMSTSSLGSD